MTFWQSITTNWKTTLTGILTFVLSVPGIVTALQQWATHQPVDWRNALMSLALAIGGGGLVAAKDSTTHSTAAQVQVATVDASKIPPKP